MAHRTVFNTETGIVETQFDDLVIFDEIAAVIAESTQLSRQRGSYLWLMDYRAAYYVISASEIYDVSILVSRAATSLGVAPFQLRRALVVRPVTGSFGRPNADFRFAQRVAEQRGQKLLLFPDLESAREWLAEERGLAGKSTKPGGAAVRQSKRAGWE